MTTEQEFLGNAPRPGNAPLATTWSTALQDAAALFEQARLAADNGDTREALAAGAEAVGMAAVAVDLRRRDYVEVELLPDTTSFETALSGAVRAEKALGDQRDQQLSDEDAEMLAREDPRLSKWDILDGIRATHPPVPPATVDYLQGGGAL